MDDPGVMLLITSEKSYLLTGLQEKLSARNIKVIFSKTDEFSIQAVTEKIDVILLYGNQEKFTSKAESAIRSKACSDDLPVLVVGDNIFIENIRTAISDDMIESIFLRPVVLDEIADHVRHILNKKSEIKPKKILLVDDSVEMLKKMKLYLETKYTVSVAKSGPLAIKYLAITIPDLILLDYEMPIVNGKQIFEMIRSEQVYASVPIIFLTSCSDREVIMDILKLKPDGYLLKSMDPDKIVKEVDHFFESR